MAILRMLYERTKRGDASWDTGRNQWEYIWTASTSTVIIRSRDQDDNFPFDVDILNSNGAPVLTVEFLNNDPNLELVSELYRSVARKHIQVDETLDGLLDELREPPF